MAVNTRVRRVIAALLLGAAFPVFAADPPEVESKIPDFSLPGLDGETVRFSDVYRDRGAVLVMLRGWPGYQCPICTAQVGGYMTERLQFRKRQLPVVFIYPGPGDNLREHAGEFTGRLELPAEFRFVIDPDFKVTRRYGLRWDAEGETAYPATFIVDREGRVVFRKVSDSHAGRVPANRALEIFDSRIGDAGD